MAIFQTVDARNSFESPFVTIDRYSTPNCVSYLTYPVNIPYLLQSLSIACPPIQSHPILSSHLEHLSDSLATLPHLPPLSQNPTLLVHSHAHIGLYDILVDMHASVGSMTCSNPARNANTITPFAAHK